MVEKSDARVFPRRDADGRVVSLGEMLAAGLLGTAVGLAALALVEGILALIGLGKFGRGSGWLAAILPALLYFDDLRAWRGHGVRFAVALGGAAVAIAAGLAAVSLMDAVPPMISGAVGAVVAVAIYGPLWFVGVRWLSGHLG